MDKNNKTPLSIYIHYPFCKSKCPYCDFNSHVENQINDDAFEKAYLKQIRYFSQKLKHRTIKTIFFGGGTPSLMPVVLVEKIISEIGRNWSMATDCEITLEANPTSFEARKFGAFKQAGLNRISIGVQALNDKDLKFLGRNHSAKEAMDSIKKTAKIFDNYSFDLIYCRSQQKFSDWKSELEKAIELSPNHLSLYQLTIEKGTDFYQQFQDKKFTLPNNDLAADFYELTAEITDKNQMPSYEISNYSKVGFESQHNLNYWQGGDYLGIGAGAHSRIYFDDDSQRRSIIMWHKPKKWLDNSVKEKLPIQQIEVINKKDLLIEILLMSLRLTSGLTQKMLNLHFKDLKISQIIDEIKIYPMLNKGLVFLSNDNLRITKKGRLLSNMIISEICRNIK